MHDPTASLDNPRGRERPPTFSHTHMPRPHSTGGTPNGPRALARRLERDKGRVSRDFGVLAEHGIIECETHGRAKRPKLAQEHLVVEPLV